MEPPRPYIAYLFSVESEKVLPQGWVMIALHRCRRRGRMRIIRKAFPPEFRREFSEDGIRVYRDAGSSIAQPTLQRPRRLLE